ncbi:NAD(P)-dependent oxidoreductase [Sabulicella glaciei]|uniref:NAD(P)-dependent oxidoreductase n=1 Tax=Sabulicella glaciei TaxID=2984948 RepID=A0ABT3NZ14_9PROT|nr:NAD(P)-dependent oxidoreductase [Roseococcus sp. MDT2-1-1]
MTANVLTVGFVGLGAMGGPMVERLISAGHRLLVHDVSPAALAQAEALGATALPSPAAVADAAPIVFVSLPTPDVVKQVALGAGGLVEGSAMRIYADLSTTGARVASEVAEGLSAKGVAVLDAPVSGGVAGAKAGTLSVMASGDRAAFEQVRDLLETIGRGTIHVGEEVGQGQTLKLVNNLIAATVWAATAEAMVMGAKAGLDPAVMHAVIARSSGRSFSTEVFMPKAVLERSFDFGFRLELMRKDVRLALAEAEALGTTMLTCTTAKQLYDHAYVHGGEGQDVTALIRLLESWGGAEVSSQRRN